MVGAVGIENNSEWNFKDLEEMLGNAKALIRNDKDAKESLLAPHFFRTSEIYSSAFFAQCLSLESASGPNSAARMAS